MLEKVETGEIMTTREAMLKYRTRQFVMEITEVVDQCDNDLGYVMYVADTDDEILKIPQSEYAGKNIAFMFGVASEPYPTIGNVVYHD
jgi:hypothetical protein